jgi:hypothetical protein
MLRHGEQLGEKARNIQLHSLNQLVNSPTLNFDNVRHYFIAVMQSNDLLEAALKQANDVKRRDDISYYFHHALSHCKEMTELKLRLQDQLTLQVTHLPQASYGLWFEPYTSSLKYTCSITYHDGKVIGMTNLQLDNESFCRTMKMTFDIMMKDTIEHFERGHIMLNESFILIFS